MSDTTLDAFDLKTIMRTARAEHILVPACNVAHLPLVEPMVETFRRLNCFALLEVARLEIHRFGSRSWQAVADEFARHADRAICRLHQDHVPVIDEDGQRVDWQSEIQQALEIGYDSVMVDGSRLPLDENIAVARTVVELAASKNVPVEAELGAVLGHEAGPIDDYDELFRSGRGFTDVEQAVRFVNETGVDWLSVAIGNIHGAVRGAARDQEKIKARLNIDHLRRLAEATGVPLVLHGGSGIGKRYVLDAVANGIVKINIGTTLRQAYEKGLGTDNDIVAGQHAVAEHLEDLLTSYYQIGATADKLAEVCGREAQ